MIANKKTPQERAKIEGVSNSGGDEYSPAGFGEKMKICWIASARSYYHPKLFEYFTAKGHQVHLISVDSSRWEINGVNIHCFPQFRSKLLKLTFTFIFGGILTRRIIKKVKPDILHAVEVDEGFCGAVSGFHPFVMTPNGSDLLVFARKYLPVKLAFKYIFKKADAVLSDSEPLREASLALGATRENNHVFQWGVDLTQFNPGISGHEVRDKHNLGDSPVVFSSRALTPNYNIETIIRSIPGVLSSAPEAKFLFVYGFSQGEDEMKNLADDLGVSQSVRFIGPVSYEEMPCYCAAADVYVSVPSSDSSPRAVYEAMACGVPPVLSDLPWTKDLIVPEQNALIVPVKDNKALASAILSLLKNTKLRESIKEANLKLVDKEFNYHWHMTRLESIYQLLCQNIQEPRDAR